MPRDARLVVTRTSDGGATFQTLDGGLDDGPRYDLIYATRWLWTGRGGGWRWGRRRAICG